ncbi:hypothetical protein scyTo_0025187 [Scyliorhinus torazame]|uniref:Uncharacterized protein n=1 Tax=Scyliorhinus torazame TaxID=75743 RepID=A0A401QGG3_SCYTO|nr:hypothetical protein [Scyliorhinus torazame]
MVSEDPSKLLDVERDVNSASTSPAAALAGGWAGWAVTGVSTLTSKFIRGSPVTGGQAAGGQPTAVPAPGATPETGAGSLLSDPLSRTCLAVCV